MTVPSDPSPRLFALVPAAGVGARAGTELPKQYAEIAGEPMLARTLRALTEVTALAGILVVISRGDAWFDVVLPGFAGPGRWVGRCGGQTRAQTVANGLDELLALDARPDDWVLVHDAARCLIQAQWVQRLIDACLPDTVGGLLALPVADTLKQAVSAGPHLRAQQTVDRSDKWAAQTPQMFRIGQLREALALAGGAVTDEASAMEHLGLAPLLVPGDARNLKITWPADFVLAEQLL